MKLATTFLLSASEEIWSIYKTLERWLLPRHGHAEHTQRRQCSAGYLPSTLLPIAYRTSMQSQRVDACAWPNHITYRLHCATQRGPCLHISDTLSVTKMLQSFNWYPAAEPRSGSVPPSILSILQYTCNCASTNVLSYPCSYHYCSTSMSIY